MTKDPAKQLTARQAQALGRLMASARSKAQLSLRSLAGAANLDLAWIHRLESGNYLAPDPKLLLKAAEVLNISPARMDQVTGGWIARSLPPVKTYFRSTTDWTEDDVALIEAEVARIQAKYGTPKTPGPQNTEGQL